MVPHALFRQTSTVPSYSVDPPNNLTCPSVQFEYVEASTGKCIVYIQCYIEYYLGKQH